jgi:hypothetical protein
LVKRRVRAADRDGLFGVEILELSWSIEGERGTLTIRCEDEVGLRALVTQLTPPEVLRLIGTKDEVLYLAISEEADLADVDLLAPIAVAVVPAATEYDRPDRRIQLGNNFLQRGLLVEAREFEVDGTGVSMRAFVRSRDEHVELIRLLDEPHGSSLASGPTYMYVRRESSGEDDLVSAYPRYERFAMVKAKKNERRVVSEGIPDPEAEPSEGATLPRPPWYGTPATTWLVPLKGASPDLELLATVFSAGHEPCVQRQRDERCYLQSSALDGVDDINAAVAIARRVVPTVNAAANLADPHYQNVEIETDLVRIDDKRGVQYPKAPVGLRVSVQPPRPDRPLGHLAAALGLRDSSVEQALSVWAMAPRSWASLYVVLELVEQFPGVSVSDRGWIRPSERRRFKQTANTLPIADDLPRHGAPKGRPPKNPMTLREAEGLIRDVLTQWVRHRYHEAMENKRPGADSTGPTAIRI